MDENKIKEVLKEEVNGLKESLKHFVKAEDMEKEIKKVSDQIAEYGITDMSAQLKELNAAAEKQGEVLAELKARGGENKEKTFRDMLIENKEVLEKFEKGEKGKLNIGTTRKAINATSITNDTMAFRETGVNEIQRGMPWIRDLFNVVTLGNNTHGTVRWFEEDTITDNSEMVAESSTPAAASDIQWVEKSLSGKRIKDFVKVSVDQLKDVDFVNDEVRKLINRNMRLKENAQLYSGDGLGNNISGILEYAPAINTVAIGATIQDATLFDLINKGKTQIRTASKDAFFPNALAINPEDLDDIRLAKDTQGRYLFPEWAINGVNSVAGMQNAENSLVTANTLLMGDFNYGTVYLWNGLMIELGFVGSDFTDGMVTIMAYERMNLQVKANDVNAFVQSADIAADITAITAI